jgi:rhodanese-related sulfurtransferase
MYRVSMVLGFLTFFLSSCVSSEKKEIDAPKLLVINVLDKALYDDCHITGSIHVPFDQVTNYVRTLSKDTEIVVYCSNYACTTSDYVAKKLYDQGFTHVMVYQGGMAEWKQHGLPTEGPGQQVYLTKTMMAPEESEQGAIPIITMRELAQKLNLDASTHTEVAA